MSRALVMILFAWQLLQRGMTARIRRKALAKQRHRVNQSLQQVEARAVPVDTAAHPGAVIANVYHVSKSWQMAALNNVLYHVAAGGAYHVAIEAFGLEFGYGAAHPDWNPCTTAEQRRVSGLYQAEPKNDRSHTYYHSHPLGHVNMTQSQFIEIVEELAVDWKGCDYDLLSRNCVSFAQALAHRLLGEGGTFPGWLSRLMDAGETLRPLFPVLGVMSYASSRSSETTSYASSKSSEATSYASEKAVEGSVAAGRSSQQAVIDFQASRERARIQALQMEHARIQALQMERAPKGMPPFL